MRWPWEKRKQGPSATELVLQTHKTHGGATGDSGEAWKHASRFRETDADVLAERTERAEKLLSAARAAYENPASEEAQEAWVQAVAGDFFSSLLATYQTSRFTRGKHTNVLSRIHWERVKEVCLTAARESANAMRELPVDEAKVMPQKINVKYLGELAACFGSSVSEESLSSLIQSGYLSDTRFTVDSALALNVLHTEEKRQEDPVIFDVSREMDRLENEEPETIRAILTQLFGSDATFGPLIQELLLFPRDAALEPTAHLSFDFTVRFPNLTWKAQQVPRAVKERADTRIHRESDFAPYDVAIRAAYEAGVTFARKLQDNELLLQGTSVRSVKERIYGYLSAQFLVMKDLLIMQEGLGGKQKFKNPGALFDELHEGYRLTLSERPFTFDEEAFRRNYAPPVSAEAAWQRTLEEQGVERRKEYEAWWEAALAAQEAGNARNIREVWARMRQQRVLREAATGNNGEVMQDADFVPLDGTSVQRRANAALERRRRDVEEANRRLEESNRPGIPGEPPDEEVFPAPDEASPTYGLPVMRHRRGVVGGGNGNGEVRPVEGDAGPFRLTAEQLDALAAEIHAREDAAVTRNPRLRKTLDGLGRFLHATSEGVAVAPAFLVFFLLLSPTNLERVRGAFNPEAGIVPAGAVLGGDAGRLGNAEVQSGGALLTDEELASVARERAEVAAAQALYAQDSLLGSDTGVNEHGVYVDERAMHLYQMETADGKETPVLYGAGEFPTPAIVARALEAGYRSDELFFLSPSGALTKQNPDTGTWDVVVGSGSAEDFTRVVTLNE